MISAKETLDTAQKQVSDFAGNGYEAAQGGIQDAIERVSRIVKIARNFGLDDVLATVGLRRGPRYTSNILTFTGGVAIGAGLGMLFAPMTGAAMRGKIGKTLGWQKLTTKMAAAEKQVEEGVSDLKQDIKHGLGPNATRVMDHVKEHVTDTDKNQAKDGAAQRGQHRAS